MKRGRVIGILICVLVLGMMGLYFVNRGPAEPVYQGKKLSEWCSNQSLRDMMEHSYIDEEATSAIQHIGTNALPFFMSWDPPSWKTRLASSVRKKPWLRRNSYARAFLHESETTHATAAFVGFFALGSAAQPAVPELTRIANDAASPDRATRAMYCLGLIGNEGFAALLSILREPRQSEAARAQAAHCISIRDDLGTNGALAVKILVDCLRNTNLTTSALIGLGRLSLEPELVVPAITESLRDNRRVVRVFASDALGAYGPRAREAVPVLTTLLNDMEPVLPPLHPMRS